MGKKLILCIIICIISVGCNRQSILLQDTLFNKINTNLIYDKNTKIIYYYNETHYYFVSIPYYSENGKLCKYNEQEQKIEELK